MIEHTTNNPGFEKFYGSGTETIESKKFEDFFMLCEVFDLSLRSGFVRAIENSSILKTKSKMFR